MNANTQTTHTSQTARTLRLALALSGVLTLSACVVPVQTVRHDPQPQVNKLQFRKGQVFAGAFQAGTDRKGDALYFCSVNHKGGVHLGKVRPGIGGCHIGYGGREVSFNTYRVGLGYGHWANGKKSSIPYGAVAYGRENGQPLYACRAMHRAKVYQVLMP